MRYLTKTLLILSLSFLSSTNVASTPAQVVVIRHANKNLKVEENSLDYQGRMRAAALGVMLSQSAELTEFGPPSAIFAVKTDPVYYDTVRTVQTVTNLSALLDVEIQTPYILPQTAELGRLILTDPQYDKKYVVICWEHKHIPELLKSLGVQNPSPSTSREIFDRLWIIKYNPDGSLKSFEDTSQHLMYGDSEK